jgi:hypothetical protein
MTGGGSNVYNSQTETEGADADRLDVQGVQPCAEFGSLGFLFGLWRGEAAITEARMTISVPHSIETIKEARRLWDAGLTAGTIADALSTSERKITRNAIIGLAHRNNFPERPSPIIRRRTYQG